MNNAISFFEIPATNFNRAVKFYQEIFNIEFSYHEIQDIQMAFFPSNGSGIGGAIVCGKGYEPTTSGSLMYLDGGRDLGKVLEKVEPAGGKTIVNKTMISEDMGYFAFFNDTEGNRVALHSLQ